MPTKVSRLRIYFFALGLVCLSSLGTSLASDCSRVFETRTKRLNWTTLSEHRRSIRVDFQQAWNQFEQLGKRADINQSFALLLELVPALETDVRNFFIDQKKLAQPWGFQWIHPLRLDSRSLAVTRLDVLVRIILAHRHGLQHSWIRRHTLDLTPWVWISRNMRIKQEWAEIRGKLAESLNQQGIAHRLPTRVLPFLVVIESTRYLVGLTTTAMTISLLVSTVEMAQAVEQMDALRPAIEKRSELYQDTNQKLEDAGMQVEELFGK